MRLRPALRPLSRQSKRHTVPRPDNVILNIVKRIVLLFALAIATPLLATERQVLSDVYKIVKKYKSMEGPAGAQTSTSRIGPSRSSCGSPRSRLRSSARTERR